MTLAAVDDEIQLEAEIKETVRDLERGVGVGLSGMCVEDLKGWLQESKLEKNPVHKRW